MQTWTSWAKKLTKLLKESQADQSIWEVKYLPEYRYIGFSGDGLLAWRGVASRDGQTIMIVAVNAHPEEYGALAHIRVPYPGCPGVKSNVWGPIRAHVVLTRKEFEQACLTEVSMPSKEKYEIRTKVVDEVRIRRAKEREEIQRKIAIIEADYSSKRIQLVGVGCHRVLTHKRNGREVVEYIRNNPRCSPKMGQVVFATDRNAELGRHWVGTHKRNGREILAYVRKNPKKE